MRLFLFSLAAVDSTSCVESAARVDGYRLLTPSVDYAAQFKAIALLSLLTPSLFNSM
jgi:hypothetical protein